MNVSNYFDDLAQHEGVCTWLYCDSRGLVTIGIGNLVPSVDACVALPLLGPDMSPSSDDEKRAAWAAVKTSYAPNHSADFYRAVTIERMAMNDVKELVASRLENEFLPGIVRLCHDFDLWPLPARKAIVDMAYNLGVGGLAKFHNLIAACQAHDWATAAHECHRATSRDSRNAWTAQMFIDASVSR